MPALSTTKNVASSKNMANYLILSYLTDLQA